LPARIVWDRTILALEQNRCLKYSRNFSNGKDGRHLRPGGHEGQRSVPGLFKGEYFLDRGSCLEPPYGLGKIQIIKLKFRKVNTTIPGETTFFTNWKKSSFQGGEAFPNGILGELGQAPDTKLVDDLLAMGIHSFYADLEKLGYLTGAPTFGQKPQDLALPGSKHRNTRLAGAGG